MKELYRRLVRFFMRIGFTSDTMYMGMATLKGKKVCVSVGYTYSYANKKALQFKKLCPEIELDKVRIVRMGEGDDCGKLDYQY